MKSGKTLMELAQTLTNIRENSKDFIVPTERLSAKVDEGKLKLAFINGSEKTFAPTSWARQQLAGFTDIPKQYFDRIAIENPELAAQNINHGLSRQNHQTRMVRTVGSDLRALLSPKYRILDSHDLLEAVLPSMIENGLEVVSSEITDKRLFIKALSPRLKSDISVGDTVQYGLMISTSDVGSGGVKVDPLVYRLVCKNGMIMDSAIRKFHIGRNQATDGDVQELLSDKTKEMSDAAFWMQVRDIVLSTMKPEHFQKQVDKMKAATEDKIQNFDLPQVVELAMKSTGIAGDEKKNSILAALASGNEGAGLTRWGLVNSFTRAAQADQFSYEESIEMERAGGQILELPRNQWRVLAEAK